MCRRRPAAGGHVEEGERKAGGEAGPRPGGEQEGSDNQRALVALPVVCPLPLEETVEVEAPEAGTTLSLAPK